MKRKISKRILAIPVILYLVSLPYILSAGQDVHPYSAENPLITEMIILDKTFREIVSAVALGDSVRVHKALESMHGTKEKTHKGIHSGVVKIPKNADRIEEFVKLDEAFHRDLEVLAHAAHENNQKRMLSLTKKLLNSCVNCHQTFRGKKKACYGYP